MNGWLKGNRAYLVALAVLLPGAFVASLTVDWFEYANARAGDPVIVPTGEEVGFAGSQWSLSDSAVLTFDSVRGRDLALATGTELITATLKVDPGDEPPFCSVELEDKRNGRVWDEALSEDSDYRVSEGSLTYCDSEPAGPYSVEFVFVVPIGVADDARLRLEVREELPRFLVFDLGL
jgi:hypothetical protein